MQGAVGGVYECGTVDLSQNQQGTHLMSLWYETNPGHFKKSLLLCAGIRATPEQSSGFRTELLPCCRPGAGQCSCSHPAVSGQPWPGEGGWLHDTKISLPLNTDT